MPKIFTTSKKSGFTLIELLVVISIIGVLSALLITNLVGARTRAADAKKKADMSALATSLRLYYNDYQAYPPGSGNSFMQISGANVAYGAPFELAGTSYMKAMPDNYSYYSAAPYDSYILFARLSNASDDQLTKNFNKCCPSGNTKLGCPVSLTSNQYILCED